MLVAADLPQPGNREGWGSDEADNVCSTKIFHDYLYRFGTVRNPAETMSVLYGGATAVTILGKRKPAA